MKKNNKNKNEEHSTVSLPDELIVEIVLRLPVKSVLRFRCVCKLWLSLIANPQFAQLHFDLAAAPCHRFLLRGTGDFIKSIDTDASLCDDSAVLNLHLPVSTAPLAIKSLQICGSCRGFVLLHQYVTELSLPPPPRCVRYLIVWNPSTGVHKLVPPDSHVNEMKEYFVFGFGYDPSTNDYLVIFIKFINFLMVEGVKYLAMIKLFSLKSNSWDCNFIETNAYISPFDRSDFITGSFLNGALHWLVYSDRAVVIMAFDLVERNLSEIPLPPVLNDRVTYLVGGLKVIGECLSVWCTIGGNVEMWTMKEYKVLSSWTRSFSFGDEPLYVKFSPICLTKDNALLGLAFLYRQRLLKLFGKTEGLREHFTYDFGPDVDSSHLQTYLYRESLLSLPND